MDQNYFGYQIGVDIASSETTACISLFKIGSAGHMYCTKDIREVPEMVKIIAKFYGIDETHIRYEKQKLESHGS